MKKKPLTREVEQDHEYTSEMMCPYCGLKHSDSSATPKEFEGMTQCLRCRRLFKFVRYVVKYLYVTKKIPLGTQIKGAKK